MGSLRHLRALSAVVVLGVTTARVPGQTTASGAVAGQAGKGETLSLDEVIARAEAIEPSLAAAKAEKRVTSLERADAKAALLPTVLYHNQAVYTQPNGIPASRIGQVTGAPSPIFIANNAIREYASQGLFNETIGLQQVASVRAASAAAARSAAEYETARRGLVATVVNLFYGVISGSERVELPSRQTMKRQRSSS